MNLKKFAVLVMAGALVCGLLAMAGCSPKPEDVIRQGVTEELEGLKTLDDATLDELMSGADSAAITQFTEYGIDAREFMKSYLNGFDYTVGDVTVDGDTAQVEVTFTSKSFSDFETAIQDAVTQMIADPTIFDLSADALNTRIGETFMAALDTVPVRTTEPFTLEYERVDNTWSPTSNAENAIVSALFN